MIMASESFQSESMCEVCCVNTTSYCSSEKAVMLAEKKNCSITIYIFLDQIHCIVLNGRVGHSLHVVCALEKTDRERN